MKIYDKQQKTFLGTNLIGIIFIGFWVCFGVAMTYIIIEGYFYGIYQNENTKTVDMTVTGKTIVSAVRSEYEVCVLKDSDGNKWLNDQQGCAYENGDFVSVKLVPSRYDHDDGYTNTIIGMKYGSES